MDAERFMSNLLAYSVLNCIETNDFRKVAAFQLHLDGPAQSWFVCLDDNNKNTSESVSAAFKDKYLSENNKPIIVMEMEQFLSLHLLPHHHIEDYFSKIMDKGRRLGKHSQEILLKFIERIPSQLAFFCSSREPRRHSGRTDSCKVGGSLWLQGYSTSHNNTPGTTHSSGQQTLPVPVNVCAANRIRADDRFCELEEKLDSLYSQFQALNTGKKESCRSSAVTCHSCKGQGHYKRQCNWARGQCDSQSQCQLCEQYGHTGLNCAKYQHSGNARRSRDTRRDPLRGQQ